MFVSPTPTPPPPAGASSPLTPKSFTQADFLRMLVTQLSTQDPFKAADSSKIMENFMTMANFQATQEASVATKKVGEQIAAVQKLDQILLGRSLVGSRVELADASGARVSGAVDQVLMDDGGIRLVVLGSSYPIENLVSFSNPPPTSP